MRANVAGLMSGELGGWLESQAQMRMDAKETAHSRWTWGAVLLMPLLAFMWFGPDWSGQLKVFASAIGIGGVGYFGYRPIAEAKKTIKIGINSAIAADLGISYEHDVEPGAEFGNARQFGLVPKYDRSKFEDCWFGDLEGHAFQLYEAHLEEQRGSGKNRRYVTVFKGAIITMGFGRSFYSTTLLQRAGKNNKWFGLGGRKDEIKVGGTILSYVDQVHPAFEDKFDIYSTDQVEARVIAHPSYIEHLLAIEEAFSGDAVRALFVDGQIIIAVESGNLFESGSMDPEKDRFHAEQAADQFASLAELAVAFNQTERGQTSIRPSAPPIA